MSATNVAAMAGDLWGGSDPEGLVPSQWEDRLRAGSSSEQRLMAAVVIDAIRDYRQGGNNACGRRARQLSRLAACWIASRDRSWPYSFESICAVFDVDPDALRRTLARERMLGGALAATRKRRNLVLTGPGPRVNRGRRHVAVAKPAMDAALLPNSQVA